MPSDLIDVDEEFHICIEDTKENVALVCYEIENGPKSEPEHPRIIFVVISNKFYSKFPFFTNL
jgi:hypothetical protein